MISLRAHNILDYIGGAVLLGCPYIFGFADLDVARNVFLMAGLFLILYSLLTNYQFAVIRVIPLGVHMTLDVVIGAFLFVAPWVLNYRGFLTAGQEYLHYAIGLSVFALVGLTDERTEEEKRAHQVKPSQTATSGRV